MMSKISISLLVSLAAAASPGASAAVPSLTTDNYAQETAGKTVFLKFFAPWCGHCKAMAEDWEKLAADYADKKDVLIAEIDCTSPDSQDVCDDNNVEGFPTLRYGDPMALEDYDGGREYDELSEFAKENLKPTCSPSNVDLCDDETKEVIRKLEAMSEDELAEAIDKVEDQLEENEKQFQDEEDKLQDMYEALADKFLQKAKDIKKESNLGFMKAVLASKPVGDAKEEL